MARRALVLLSGGLDSATATAIAHSEGYLLHALTFRCGRREEAKLAAARQLAAHFGVSDHIEVDIDERALPKPGGGAVRQLGDASALGHNTIFLSFAVAWAEALEVDDLFLGLTAADRRDRPDARLGWVEAFRRTGNLASHRRLGGHHLQIHTPLAFLSGAQIVRRGRQLGVDYSQTRNCYRLSPAGEACAECEACLARHEAFSGAGLEDPVPYCVSDAA
ncbi:MAG TPA: 7-cyano-7-deazaguanine synthase [Thermoleophilaceae bacterium]|nr:7-cyano-7-deazaguanine synthase [Thermoleophilaceae bacterium]